MRRLKETNGSTDLLRGKIQANLFYEASTRTDASFSIAMKRLGGEVHNIVGVQFSSVSKGETLTDTVRILSGYADVVVLRHPEVGAAGVAAAAIHAERGKRRTADGRPLLPVPVINAGDGVGEHPTQALLDAFTIRQKRGRLDHLIVALGWRPQTRAHGTFAGASPEPLRGQPPDLRRARCAAIARRTDHGIADARGPTS